MPTNADYTREYFDIMESLGGDVESRRSAYDYMRNSTAIVHHQVVASSFVPRLFNAETYTVMKKTARNRPRHPLQGHPALSERPRLSPRVRLRPAP